MQALTIHEGVAAALLRNNIDTDAIIPSREMKTVSKVGLADGLFAGWRYLNADAREIDPGFVLNRPAQKGTSILLAGQNFGCGSSREHAVWALKEFGIRVIVAPSFGAIFVNNCVRNGLVPVVLDERIVRSLADRIVVDPHRHPLRLDLEACTLSDSAGAVHHFELPADQREMLMKGLDPIALTLEMVAAIDAFQSRDRIDRPWIYCT